MVTIMHLTQDMEVNTKGQHMELLVTIVTVVKINMKISIIKIDHNEIISLKYWFNHTYIKVTHGTIIKLLINNT